MRAPAKEKRVEMQITWQVHWFSFLINAEWEWTSNAKTHVSQSPGRRAWTHIFEQYREIKHLKSLSHKTHVSALCEREAQRRLWLFEPESRTIYFRNVVKFARQTNTCTINKGLLCFCDVGVTRNSRICQANLFMYLECRFFAATTSAYLKMAFLPLDIKNPTPVYRYIINWTTIKYKYWENTCSF